MKKRDNLLISSGKLSEEDASWDTRFWQSVSTTVRFQTVTDLIKTAHWVRFRKPVPMLVDRSKIHTGKYTND